MRARLRVSLVGAGHIRTWYSYTTAQFLRACRAVLRLVSHFWMHSASDFPRPSFICTYLDGCRLVPLPGVCAVFFYLSSTSELLSVSDQLPWIWKGTSGFALGQLDILVKYASKPGLGQLRTPFFGRTTC